MIPMPKGRPGTEGGSPGDDPFRGCRRPAAGPGGGSSRGSRVSSPLAGAGNHREGGAHDANSEGGGASFLHPKGGLRDIEAAPLAPSFV